MARRKRFAPANVIAHVVNRGNDRRTLFADTGSYAAFLNLLRDGSTRVPIRLFGYCLMPNHVHLLVQPMLDGAVSAYMQWVTGRYACDLRRVTRTLGHGHVFQRRFWCVPIDERLQILTVLRYIEANPVRAGLVETAEKWEWCSLAERQGRDRQILDALPFGLPEDWRELVNLPQREPILRRIRESLVAKPGPRPRHDRSRCERTADL